MVDETVGEFVCPKGGVCQLSSVKRDCVRCLYAQVSRLEAKLDDHPWGQLDLAKEVERLKEQNLRLTSRLLDEAREWGRFRLGFLEIDPKHGYCMRRALDIQSFVEGEK